MIYDELLTENKNQTKQKMSKFQEKECQNERSKDKTDVFAPSLTACEKIENPYCARAESSTMISGRR